jgi:hypothetical protein
METLVRLAALNNAHVYAVVCRAHGIEVDQTDDALRVLGRPPRFFSNAVTLTPEARPEPDGSPWGMKDSYSTYAPEGCSVLFEADWIYRVARTSEPALDWRVVTSEDDLGTWLEGWGAGDADVVHFPPQFPSSLLGEESVRFVSGYRGGAFVAGCLLNHSPGAVGISNAFCLEPATLPFADFAWAANEWLPELPVVGYERGDALRAALEVGFESIGRLRVWMR